MSELGYASIGFALVTIGVFLAFIAVIIMVAKGSGGNGRTRGGAVVLIGPIPIIFGRDRESVKTLAVLAIILVIIASALMLIPWLVTR